jgi:hypothetical protein
MKNAEITMAQIEQMAEEKAYKIISIIVQGTLDMYTSINMPIKKISPKKANTIYGKSRMTLWEKQGWLQTTSTEQGRIRYNKNQLDALLRAEKQLLIK